MRARAPASSANLGPGFDALALALACHVSVTVEPAARLEVSATGEGADLPRDASHLAARVAVEVARRDDLAVSVHSDIPVGRGLGSSAALAVAAAAAAGAADPLSYGAAVDGHPENAAASTLGGLVAATTIGDKPLARQLRLDPALRFVVLIPDRVLLTADARGVLPDAVPRADAAFNLGRMGVLVAGLADHTQLVGEAAEDRLHQDARRALFPEAPDLLAGLRRAGALAACWSGAGPSLLAICTEETRAAVAAGAERLLGELGVDGSVRSWEADRRGVTTWPSPGH